MFLELACDVIRSVARLRLRAHTLGLRVEGDLDSQYLPYL